MTATATSNRRRSEQRPAPETIRGRVVRVVHPRDPRDFDDTKGGFVVLTLEVEGRPRPYPAKGHAHQLPAVGSDLELVGHHKQDPKWGEQFAFERLSITLPSTRDGAVRFLQMIPGIGPARAEQLVEQFGPDVCTRIKSDPTILAGVKGVSQKQVEAAATFIEDAATLDDVERQLCDLGFGNRTRSKAREYFGRNLPRILAEDPYQLVRLDRVGFAQVDDALMSLQRFPAASPKRAAAAIVQALKDAADDGHTWQTYDELDARLDKLKLAIAIPADARRDGIAHAVKLDNVMRVEGDAGVALLSVASAEEFCADRLRAMIHNSKPLGDFARVPEDLRRMLTDEQMQAVENACRYGVSVLTGGPGTGKTTTERAMIPALAHEGLAILAPTGKAAKRAAEVTGYDPARVMTVHRFVGQRDRETGEYRQGEDWHRVVIVDETSMVSVDILEMLLRVLTLPNHHLVLIGDIDQLPSIGAGAVLRDLIDSGTVPTVRLTKIHRQAQDSRIVVNAHAINRGELPNNSRAADDKHDWFAFWHDEERWETEEYAELVARRYVSACDLYKLDPRRDAQLLTPMHRGPLGVEAMNGRLRHLLNRFDPEKTPEVDPAWPFRPGDKVLVTKNQYDLGVVNGDVGEVVRYRPFGAARDENNKPLPVSCTVRIDDGREVEFAGDSVDHLTQAWAMTVHKSQGSEYPLVFVVLHRSQFIMLTRQILYTAITRARQCVVICGTPDAVPIAVGNATSNDRRTRLGGLLSGARRDHQGGRGTM